MIKWINKKRNKKGFTLVELVVVIAILGILAAIAIPRLTGFTDRAKAQQALVNAKSIATAIDGLLAEGKKIGDEEAFKDVEAAIDAIKVYSGVDDGKITMTADEYEKGHFEYKIDDYYAVRDVNGLRSTGTSSN